MPRRTSLWFYIPPPVIAGALIAFWQYRTHRDTPLPEADDPAPPTEEVSKSDTPPPPATNTAPEPAPVETTAEAPKPLAPQAPITDVQEATRLFPELAGTVFPKERIATWLAQSDLLRRIVGIVDCLANGVSPKGQMEFLAPRAPYQAVRGADGRLHAAPANSLRTKAVVETFCLANTRTLVAAYGRLEPVFDKLYRDLGYPDARFRDALGRACKVLLATPVPDQEPALVRSGTTCFYADARLEKLPAAQKHLLRLGVRDAKRVQAKIRQLAGALRLEIQ
jgi:hypothetical protein